MQTDSSRPEAFITRIAPSPFPESEDRRQYPRIPYDERVRLGPATEATRAELVAEDLSAQGIFLKCDQPVQTGALFSLELDLPNGEHIYIPEAEVLYNRGQQSGSTPGFGACFRNLPQDVQVLLSESALFSGLNRAASMMPTGLSELPTSIPSVQSVQLGAVQYQESEIASAVGEAQESELPGTELPSVEIQLSGMSGLPSLGGSEIEIARDHDVAGRLSICEDHITSRLPHRRRLSEIEKKEEDSEIVLASLPIRYRARSLDLLAGAWDACRDRPFAAIAGLSATLLIGLFALGALADGAAPEETPRVTETITRVTAVDRGLDADVHGALVAPEVPAPSPVDASPAVERVETKPTPIPPKVEAPPAAATGEVGRARFSLPAGAEVKRTMHLVDPDRFVIDLEGHPEGVEMIGHSDAVHRVRIGRHEDFTRIVVDVKSEFSKGTVNRDGGALQVELHR